MTVVPEDQPVVLVVDDDALLRWHATDVLEQNGYDVLEAQDALSALQIMEQRPDVRLLFTDVQMPGCRDGVDLARAVHERWPHVLLIVTSGGVSLKNEELPDDGRFVAKPYQDQRLLSQIEELISKDVPPVE